MWNRGKRIGNCVRWTRKSTWKQFCFRSKLIIHPSNCSRSALTAHCINSGHAELFDALAWQSNILQMRQYKIIFCFPFSESALHIHIFSKVEVSESAVTYISLAFDSSFYPDLFSKQHSWACIIFSSFFFFFSYSAQWETSINNAMEMTQEVRLLNKFSYTLFSWNKWLKT